VKRFVFALERVLKFKQRRELLAEIQQKQASAALQAAQAEAEALHEQLSQVCARLLEKLGVAQETSLWLAGYRQSASLEQALQGAKGKVERATKDLDVAGAVRKQAAIEVETLLVLRRRQWQEHHDAVQHAQQEHLDELGLRRWQTARAGKPGSGGMEGART
jgi:flagellar export protein FliJ